MGVIMADQIGETELRDTFLARLKERLTDWFTYSGEDDISYLSIIPVGEPFIIKKVNLAPMLPSATIILHMDTLCLAQ